MQELHHIPTQVYRSKRKTSGEDTHIGKIVAINVNHDESTAQQQQKTQTTAK